MTVVTALCSLAFNTSNVSQHARGNKAAAQNTDHHAQIIQFLLINF